MGRCKHSVKGGKRRCKLDAVWEGHCATHLHIKRENDKVQKNQKRREAMQLRKNTR
jgi:hypothetical protein